MSSQERPAGGLGRITVSVEVRACLMHVVCVNGACVTHVVCVNGRKANVENVNHRQTQSNRRGRICPVSLEMALAN